MKNRTRRVSPRYMQEWCPVKKCNLHLSHLHERCTPHTLRSQPAVRGEGGGVERRYSAQAPAISSSAHPRVRGVPEAGECARESKVRLDIDIEVPNRDTRRFQHVSTSDFVFGVLRFLDPKKPCELSVLFRSKALGAHLVTCRDHFGGRGNSLTTGSSASTRRMTIALLPGSRRSAESGTGCATK